MDTESIFIVVAIVGVLMLGLLKVISPRTYDKYILRDMTRPAPSRSSRTIALVILAGVAYLGVRFGMYLLRGTGQKQVLNAPIGPHSIGGYVETWVGLLCVSITGIIISLFPVQVVTKLIRKRVTLSPTDEETTKKIRIIGRLLGALFLLGAVFIARHLV